MTKKKINYKATKTNVHYRLSDSAIAGLDYLSDRLNISKTEVVEKAVTEMYQNIAKNNPFPSDHPLHRFWGILSDEEAAVFEEVLSWRESSITKEPIDLDNWEEK